MVHPSLFQGTKFIFYKFKFFVFVLAPECHGNPATGTCQLLVDQRGRGRAFLSGRRRRAGGRGCCSLEDHGCAAEASDHVHVSIILLFKL